MTGAELHAIRLALGMSLTAFGRRLGYRGKPSTIQTHIRRMEAGTRPITAQTATRVCAIVAQQGEFHGCIRMQ
jgi:transcriptional regulator with XRE-family HTH domain